MGFRHRLCICGRRAHLQHGFPRRTSGAGGHGDGHLGHRLTQHGLTRQAAKLEAIEQWAIPTTQTELRSFIWVIGYYRRFVDGFARIAQPLIDLLREGQFEYPWPAAAQGGRSFIATRGEIYVLWRITTAVFRRARRSIRRTSGSFWLFGTASWRFVFKRESVVYWYSIWYPLHFHVFATWWACPLYAKRITVPCSGSRKFSMSRALSRRMR